MSYQLQQQQTLLCVFLSPFYQPMWKFKIFALFLLHRNIRRIRNDGIVTIESIVDFAWTNASSECSNSIMIREWNISFTNSTTTRKSQATRTSFPMLCTIEQSITNSQRCAWITIFRNATDWWPSRRSFTAKQALAMCDQKSVNHKRWQINFPNNIELLTEIKINKSTSRFHARPKTNPNNFFSR